MAEILPNRIKGQDLTPLKTKHPSSTPYKYGWISWLEHQQIQVQIWQKNQVPLLVILPFFSFLLSAIPTTNCRHLRLVHHHLLHKLLARLPIGCLHARNHHANFSPSSASFSSFSSTGNNNSFNANSSINDCPRPLIDLLDQ